MSAGLWLAAAGTDPTIFVQYGAVGFVAATAVVVARVLFGRLERQYKERDEEREREIERATLRADRLEVELSKVYDSVRGSMLALTAANQAVAEAVTRLRRDA